MLDSVGKHLERHFATFEKIAMVVGAEDCVCRFPPPAREDVQCAALDIKSKVAVEQTKRGTKTTCHAFLTLPYPAPDENG